MRLYKYSLTSKAIVSHFIVVVFFSIMHTSLRAVPWLHSQPPSPPPPPKWPFRVRSKLKSSAQLAYTYILKQYWNWNRCLKLTRMKMGTFVKYNCRVMTRTYTRSLSVCATVTFKANAIRFLIVVSKCKCRCLIRLGSREWKCNGVGEFCGWIQWKHLFG